ncbi:hypothetical protein [Priestia endophytica]|uniref:hypothetical protein n=1 Tax=Priestia endophytica TaxID=135735 RepID=UPI001CEF5FD1|nr:hypothetical protein [Priestia endophytica]MCM3541184.1 hypothetical protein [Priestia endophytica]
MPKGIKRVKMDGFRMHQSILEEFRFIRDESFDRPPASAYIVYFTMLKQLHIENNERGILKEYNLAYWAKKLQISYSTLYNGKCFLERYHFVKEEIQKGRPVLVLRDIEKLNKPERPDVRLNYLIIPHALFETNILAEFARTSNPEGIELLLSLLNQFRTSMSHSNEINLEKLRHSRRMSVLKKQLNKKAKDVRRVLSILEALFEVQFVGLTYRGNQVWIQKVEFYLKAECICENTDEFDVNSLLARFSHEITYFLDQLGFRYKPRDKKDIMISFKQEVVNKVLYLVDDTKDSYTYRDQFLHNFFTTTLDNIRLHIDKVNQDSIFTFKSSMGAFFRTSFRKHFRTAIKKIPEGMVHEAKVREYRETLNIPALFEII